MFTEVELSRSIVLDALRAIDDERADVPQLAIARQGARLRMRPQLVGSEAVQMHGGIGVTDEDEIGFFLKRARVAEADPRRRRLPPRPIRAALGIPERRCSVVRRGRAGRGARRLRQSPGWVSLDVATFGAPAGSSLARRAATHPLRLIRLFELRDEQGDGGARGRPSRGASQAKRAAPARRIQEARADVSSQA